jgi:transposase-like protein
MSIPNFDEIGDIFTSPEQAFDFLVSSRVLEIPTYCPQCINGKISEHYKFNYRCCVWNCRFSFSIFKDTFFEGTHLPIHQILLLGYLWLSGAQHSTIEIITGLSNATVCKWVNYYRVLVANDLENHEDMIGGPGIVVEVDESKFGKRKYHRGHHVEGAWVVGGVERTDARRMFAVVVEDRSGDTLKEILRDHIAQGSILFTDCWKGYRPDDLTELGYDFATVNHTKTFVDEDTGCCTNTIEGTWNGMKRKIPKRHYGKKFLDGELLVFIWRRKYELKLWKRLLHAIKCVVWMP